MKWEFLIQKEGEPWLSVQSPLEIEAGSYRFAARTQRVNVEVEVSLTYQGDILSLGYKHQRHVNAKGLIAIAWTDIKPGWWQLRCGSDVISEFLGETWQENLQFQVVSAAETAVGDRPELAAVASEEVEEIEQAFAEIAVEDAQTPALSSAALPTNDLLECQQNQPPLLAPLEFEAEASEPVIELRLSLYEDTFVRHQEEPILISGQIDIAGVDQSNNWELVQGTLRYLLRDPRTTQILLDLEQRISEQTLPLIFSSSLEIPFEASLLLGEVVLEIPADEGSEQLVPVARQSFAVTADLEELFGSVPVRGIENQFSEQNVPVAIRRLSLFNPINKTNRTMRSHPSSNQILPPKISTASTAKTDIKLPNLPKLYSSSIFATGSNSDRTAGDRVSVDEAFDALKLEERFWSRLNALREEPEELETSLSEFSPDDD